MNMMMSAGAALLSLFPVFALGLSSSSPTLLREYPFIMSHDAASGYLNESDKVIYETRVRYSKTQSVGMAEQCDCGARAFDYRPYIKKDGQVIAHHGSTLVNVPMKETVESIRSWLAARGNGEPELIILYISHITGEGEGEDEVDNSKVMAVLDETNTAYIADCSQLQSMTYQEALQTSGLIPLLAIFDCMEENYDPSITCYGYDKEKNTNYCCYKDSAEIPLRDLDRYCIENTHDAEEYSASASHLWMTQAHWQSSEVSVPMGLLHNSSVLLDESRSNTNQRLAAALLANQLGPYINMVEVDNVCDGGLDIYKALSSLVVGFSSR